MNKALSLQKNLFSICTPPEPTNYVTAYLKLNLTQDQIKTVSKTVSKTNRILKDRVFKLRQGYFDDRCISIDIPTGSGLNLDIPYEAFVDKANSQQADHFYEDFYKNKLISPSDLNCLISWPDTFKVMNAYNKTVDLHVTLLPIIQFEYEEDVWSFTQKFESVLKEKQLIKKNIPLTISEELRIYSKVNFSKFFLAHRILKNDIKNAELFDLSIALNKIRLTLDKERAGKVFGEIYPDSVIDWENADAHCTVGANIPPNLKESIGDIELEYLNKVLLNDVSGEKIETSGEIVLVANSNKINY